MRPNRAKTEQIAAMMRQAGCTGKFDKEANGSGEDDSSRELSRICARVRGRHRVGRGCDGKLEATKTFVLA